jgi:hypothetical protein
MGAGRPPMMGTEVRRKLSRDRHYRATFVVLDYGLLLEEKENPMAEFHPTLLARSASADASVALSPARDRLGQAIAALALAQGNLEGATAPVRRLDAVLAESERLNRELACLQCEDEAELGRWIAEGSFGTRPQPSTETVAVNASLVALSPEVRAVSSALPAARAAQEAAAERVRLAAAERDAALDAVAVEAAALAAGELTEMLNRVLTVEARIHSLREALGVRPGGLAASEKITRTVRQARAAAGVPRNSDAGWRLLDALALDPAATL